MIITVASASADDVHPSGAAVGGTRPGSDRGALGWKLKPYVPATAGCIGGVDMPAESLGNRQDDAETRFSPRCWVVSAGSVKQSQDMLGKAAAVIANVQSSDAVDLVSEQAYGPRAVVERIFDQAAHGLSDAAPVCEHTGRADPLDGDEPAV